MKRKRTAKTDDNDEAKIQGAPDIRNRKAKKKRNDSNPQEQDTPTSSSKMMDLDKAKPESRLNFEAHPIDNDLILKNIFEFCSANDLKNCRLVSKRWCDLSLSSWRRTAVLRAERLFGEPVRDAEHNYDEDGAVEEFKKNWSKFSNKPFQCYNVNFADHKSARYNLSADFKRKNKKMMLELFSSSLRKLNVDCGDWETMSFLLTKLPELRVLHLHLNCYYLFMFLERIFWDGGAFAFQDLKPATSKLCKLELTICKSELVENMRLPWKEIFRNLPALKFLRLDSHGGRLMLEDIIQSICDVRKEKNFSILNLQELDIIDPLTLSPVSDRIAYCIVEGQFPLKTLCIDMGIGAGCKCCNPSPLSDLLAAHAETLEFLKCGIGTEEECEKLPTLPLDECFPSKITLPKLKKLLLRNDCVRGFQLLSSLDLPNLESLRIKPRMGCEWHPIRQKSVTRHVLKSDFFMGSCFLPNLKTFFIDHATTNFTAADMKCLGKSMPNLTELGIPLGDGTFPTVWKLWPGLQSLHVIATGKTYSLLDDSAITGYSVSKNLSRLSARSRSRKPNITDLKNLRKFVLEVRTCGYGNLRPPPRTCISDFSALHGFLQLPKLDILILEIDTVCLFSASVVRDLRAHISEMKIMEPDICWECARR